MQLALWQWHYKLRSTRPILPTPKIVRFLNPESTEKLTTLPDPWVGEGKENEGINGLLHIAA